MSCAKCNQVIPHESDTWCIGCAAWETLGQELTCPWPSKALRVLAGDQVVSCVKAVRALRNYSISCLSADTSRAALTINKAKLESSGSVPRSSGVRSSEVVPRSGLEDVKCEEESESEYESSEEEEVVPPVPSKESHPTTAAKSKAAFRESLEVQPTGERHRSRRIETGRKDRHSRRGDREERKHRREGAGKVRRGGRKHSRLYRSLENPHVVTRKRPPTTYWDTPHSLQPREALERRRREK